MSLLLIQRIYIKEAFTLLFLGKIPSMLELEVKMKAGKKKRVDREKGRNSAAHFQERKLKRDYTCNQIVYSHLSFLVIGGRETRSVASPWRMLEQATV